MSHKRWVYVRTGTAPNPKGYKNIEHPSERAEVLSQTTHYRVRMSDGTEREVTSDALVTIRRARDDVSEYVTGGTGYGSGRARQEHPGMGMVGIFHQQGTPHPIHGSKVEGHQHMVSIQISSGDVEHDLAQDRYHGGRRIIEVSLSPARFAEFIAAPNRGHGVPCSITYHSVNGGPGMIPGVTAASTETKRIVDRVRGLGKEMVQKQAQARKDLEAVLAKIPKSRRAEALRLFDTGARLMTDTAPFLINSATEALEHRVTESKAEVEAFVATAIRSAGQEAIRQNPEKLLEQSALSDQDKPTPFNQPKVPCDTCGYERLWMAGPPRPCPMCSETGR